MVRFWRVDVSQADLLLAEDYLVLFAAFLQLVMQNTGQIS